MSTRCFVGLALPPDALDVLADARDALVALDPTWRDEKWVRPENLHVTVRFFGDLDDEAVQDAKDSIGAALAGWRSFGIPLTGIRAIPSERRCRMLWASFTDPQGECGKIAEAIVAATAHLGMPPEDRPFVPHATLCRARRPKRLAANALDAARSVAEEAGTFVSVPRVTLYASQLGRRGPQYSVTQEWILE